MLGNDGRIYIDGIPLPLEPKPLPPKPQKIIEDVPTVQSVPSQVDIEPSVGPVLPDEEVDVGPVMPTDMNMYSSYQVTMDTMDDGDDEGVIAPYPGVTAPYPMMPSMYGDDDEGVTAPYPGVTDSYPPMPSMYDDEDEGVTAPYPGVTASYPNASVAQVNQNTSSQQPLSMPQQKTQAVIQPVSNPSKKKVSKNLTKMVPTALRLQRQQQPQVPVSNKRSRSGDVLVMPSAATISTPVVKSTIPILPAPVQQQLKQSIAPQPIKVQHPIASSKPVQQVKSKLVMPPKKKDNEDDFANFMNEVSDLL